MTLLSLQVTFCFPSGDSNMLPWPALGKAIFWFMLMSTSISVAFLLRQHMSEFLRHDTMAKVKVMFCHWLLCTAVRYWYDSGVHLPWYAEWPNCPTCLSKFENGCYAPICPVPLGLHEMKKAAERMLQHTIFISYIFTVHFLTNHFYVTVAVTPVYI